MKGKWLAVGKFVIIEYIFKTTKIFGFFCCTWMPNWNLGCGWEACTVGAVIPTNGISLPSCLLTYWPWWGHRWGKCHFSATAFVYDVLMEISSVDCTLSLLSLDCKLSKCGGFCYWYESSLYLNWDNGARKAQLLFILIAEMVGGNLANLFPELLLFF